MNLVFYLFGIATALLLGALVITVWLLRPLRAAIANMKKLADVTSLEFKLNKDHCDLRCDRLQRQLNELKTPTTTRCE